MNEPDDAATPEPTAPPPVPERQAGARLPLILAGLALGVALVAWYQSQSAIDQLRESQRALVQDVAAMRRAPVIDLTLAPQRGAEDAVVTLVEFSDYECPFCLRHFEQTMPQIEAHYIATGRIRYAFMDWPVDQLHPQAIRAHEAAHCAGEQSRYWEMHRRLFGPAGSHTPDRLLDLARETGLHLDRFAECVGSGRSDAAIRATSRMAMEFGASGTPVFFIGRRDRSTNQVTVVRGLSGAQPYEVFAKALDEALAQAR
jgi:protein-disulfide isomerase